VTVSLERCRAAFAYAPAQDDELELEYVTFPNLHNANLFFREGDIIEVLAWDDEVWWQGRLKGKVGLFPVS
jgi:hypothetical protein